MRNTILIMVVLMLIIYGAGVLAEGKTIIGDWKGEISLPGQQLIINVHFSEENGIIKGKIDIPQQLANNLPLTQIEIEGNEVSFVLPVNPAGLFTGEIGNKQISGNFDQGPYHGSFTLEREEKRQEKKEVQKEEYSGPVQELVLETPDGKIYGTLTLPESNGQVPVVLIISGSGPTDRDGNNPLAGKSDMYKKIAQSLQKAGFAALRYDKRGIAASKEAGKNGVLFDDFITDAAGWLNKLNSDPRFNKIIILGHSQGSLVGIVAAERVKVDGLISISGTGRNIADVMLDQLSDLPKNLYQETEKIVSRLQQGGKVPEVSQELEPYFAPSIQDFLISWFNYNPAEEIQKLEIPVLLLQGSTDLQAYQVDFESLKRAYSTAESKLFKGMNHVLRKAPADRQENLLTYSNPELPLFPGLMDRIIDFIKNL